MNRSSEVGIDAGASLWKAARVGETLETEMFPAGAVEEVRCWVGAWNPERVHVTGGGGARLAAALDGVEVRHVSEFDAWARGVPRLAGEAGWTLPERFLLVSLGTGTSVLEIGGGDGTVRRLGGLALGGGTLMGLARLLCGAESFAEAAELASRGERGRVDLLVGDVYPAETLAAIALDPALTASSFAKLASREPADLAHALMGLLGENIGIACSAMAHSREVGVLVFGGSALEGNPALQRILRMAVELSGREAWLLPNGAFCGAVGAALSA